MKEDMDLSTNQESQTGQQKVDVSSQNKEPTKPTLKGYGSKNDPYKYEDPDKVKRKDKN